LFGVYGRLLNTRIEMAAELVDLTDRLHSRVQTLSGGMQRRVNLACALIHEPTVILLDEPTAALDPTSRQLLYETLGRLRSAGRAILFTTHHLDEAEQWCDRMAIIRQGSLVAIGRTDEIGLKQARMQLIGRLREELSEATEVQIRRKLPESTDFSLDGRQFELSAIDAEMLGLALAVLHSEGADIESFRTPTTRLEQLFTGDAPASALTTPALAKGA
jgi:ABC-2 type transport system ATP-binding protein